MIVDVHCAQYFVNASLAGVVLFRRRLKSVEDGLKRHSELLVYSVSPGCCCLRYWGAV